MKYKALLLQLIYNKLNYLNNTRVQIRLYLSYDIEITSKLHFW